MLTFVFRPYLFFAALAFLLPLEKRKLWGLRFIAGLLCAVIFAYTAVHFYMGHVSVPADEISQAYAQMSLNLHLYVRVMMSVYLIEILLIFLLVLFCCRISVWEALYATACAYAMQRLTSTALDLLFYSDFSFEFADQWLTVGSPAEWLIYALSFICCYYLICRRLPEKGHYDLNLGMTLFSVIIVLGVCLFLTVVGMGIHQLDHSPQYVVCLLFSLLCFIFVLWVQVYQKEVTRLKVSVETERLLRQQQKEQYAISRENMELVQMKCHDFKHQVAALRAMDSAKQWDDKLEQLESSMDAFSATAQTGNEVLDVVLTQKSLICLKKHIKYTFMADGALLSSMDPMDIFTLFGNALDNAIENVEKLADEDKKIIALILQKKGDMVFLQFENYYDHPLLEKENLFETSKPNSLEHGFGLKSMERLAKQYGGSMQISTREHVFMVSFLLPGR